MLVTRQPQDLVSVFQQGGIIAYPTEAVFGLGCDPENEEAVLRLLTIKNRTVEKGLILIASEFSQAEHFLKPINRAQLKYTVPGETTYLYPALESAPNWLTGSHHSLAIRVTRHPLARQLCEALGRALVSTSANISGQAPARTTEEVQQQFETRIDALLSGETGNLSKPTEIRDSISGEKIR